MLIKNRKHRDFIVGHLHVESITMHEQDDIRQRLQRLETKMKKIEQELVEVNKKIEDECD